MPMKLQQAAASSTAAIAAPIRGAAFSAAWPRERLPGSVETDGLTNAARFRRVDSGPRHDHVLNRVTHRLEEGDLIGRGAPLFGPEGNLSKLGLDLLGGDNPAL